MKWKHTKIIELSGGSLSSSVRECARAVNMNGYVLKEAVQKIDKLSKKVEKLENENKELREEINNLKSISCTNSVDLEIGKPMIITSPW